MMYLSRKARAGAITVTVGAVGLFSVIGVSEGERQSVKSFTVKQKWDYNSSTGRGQQGVLMFQSSPRTADCVVVVVM